MVYLQVEGPRQDLHSGVYGGTVIEPMTDLIGILGKWWDTFITQKIYKARNKHQ